MARLRREYRAVTTVTHDAFGQPLAPPVDNIHHVSGPEDFAKYKARREPLAGQDPDRPGRRWPTVTIRLESRVTSDWEPQ